MRQFQMRRGRPGNSYRAGVAILTRVLADLQTSKDDFDGHRQSAIDACTKALQELQAVQKVFQAKQAAAAAAAKAAAEQQQQQQQSGQTAPLPGTAPNPAPPQ
jgi:hypothetical protein